MFGTKHAALNLLADWKLARMEKTRSKPVVSGSLRRWQVPQRRWIKVNMDAAIFSTISAIGIGGVVRDDTGLFLRGMCK